MDMSMAKDRFCASYFMTLWYISATFNYPSACISGSLGVWDSKKLVCDFKKLDARKSVTSNFNENQIYDLAWLPDD